MAPVRLPSRHRTTPRNHGELSLNRRLRYFNDCRLPDREAIDANGRHSALRHKPQVSCRRRSCSTAISTTCSGSNPKPSCKTRLRDRDAIRCTSSCRCTTISPGSKGMARVRGAADCTVFQTFDWLSKWSAHIGAPQGRQAGDRDRRGSRAVPVPAAVRARARRPRRKVDLAWHRTVRLQRPVAGARFLAARQPAQFAQLWHEVQRLLQSIRAGSRPDRSGEDAGDDRRAAQPVLRAASRRTSTTPT